MFMKKFSSKIIILSIIIIVAYLLLTHHYIYQKIKDAGLIGSDKNHMYILNGQAASSQNLTYVALGDSLTAGTGVDNYQDSFPYLVAKKISEQKGRVTLQDFSFPGYRTDDLIKNLLAPAIAANPDIITLLIGTNDIHGNYRLATFKKNYQNILEQLTTKTHAKIYVISIPYIGSNSILLPPWNYYFDQRTASFNQAIQALVKNYKVNYIDIAEPTKDLFKKNGSHYAADNFHPSAIGYKIWADIISKGILK
jgi:lysophospholipase L1-like esterase